MSKKKLNNILKSNLFLKKRSLALGILFCLSSISIAQQPIQNKNNGLQILETDHNKRANAVDPKVISQKINLTTQYRFDQALKTQNYIAFYEEFAKYNSLPYEQLKYLDKKLYDGHTPVYWLVADLNSKLGNDYETHKWLYISIIMTKQDSELCTDPSAKNSVNYLLKAFPKAIEISRTSPQNVKPAMNEVIFFLNNLKQRSNPIWACAYGTQKLLSHQIPLIPEQRWDTIRKRVFDDFTKDFK